MVAFPSHSNILQLLTKGRSNRLSDQMCCSICYFFVRYFLTNIYDGISQQIYMTLFTLESILTEVFVVLIPPLNGRPQIVEAAAHQQVEHCSLLLDALPDQGSFLLSSITRLEGFAPGLDCLFQLWIVNDAE